MNRLTRPDVSVDPTAARLIGPEVKIENISDKLLHLILNGPTLHSVPKDTLRFLLRQLYDELKAYEDTGLTPDKIVEMYGEMKTAYDESSVPYLVEATGLQAKRIIDRELAGVQGRLIILPPPAKEGDPKPNCFYNDNGGIWCLGMAHTDGDEPTERCKQCWYCEFGYAALAEDNNVPSKKEV